ncbi:hypothetical protein AWN65_05750 [Flavobacterium covae]|nr:hypothetical protein AWN65_05750 [Flavobacterium covae]
MLNFLTQFLLDNVNFLLFAIIIVGGFFTTKVWKTKRVSATYKVLFASIVLSIIFYMIDGCGKECLKTYLFTYLFSTSFYDLAIKYFIKKAKQLE